MLSFSMVKEPIKCFICKKEFKPSHKYVVCCSVKCGNLKKKLNKPWNYGIKETRSEVIKKLSDSHKGQHSSPSTEFKKGITPWNKGFNNLGKKDFSRTKRKNGYIYIKINGIWTLEHDWLTEQSIGRKLNKDECVHHINEIRDDNSMKNLQLTTFSEHIKIHKPGPLSRKNKTF